MRFFCLFLICFFINTGLLADQSGPDVGSHIPHGLETRDQAGVSQSFESLKGEKGMVLVFYRSADWCPYCKRQLIALNGIKESVNAAGFSLVGLSYDSPETLAKFAKKRRIGFTLLSDEGSKIIDAFGLRNTTYPKDHYADGVPHPTVLILDASGKVLHKFFSTDYKKRPEPEVILEALAP